MINVFIIGSKGIPAKYGGFETFVEKLTLTSKNKNIRYHISCLSDKTCEYEYNNAKCFEVRTGNYASARAVIYDIKSLIYCINYIKDNRLQNCVIYILACRIGPFLKFYTKKLEKMGIKVLINPDGHEWKRGKWNWFIKKYWKYSEKLMVKAADIVVCDSIGIKKYIDSEYNAFKKETAFIAYGADIKKATLTIESQEVKEWYDKFGIKANDYYLMVGRFEPENNVEAVVKEFLMSNSAKDLVIISNVKNNKLYKRLLKSTQFNKNPHVKFVGTLYDQEVLKVIRENAYAYIHGHEVGGTNPSLLEAMATTKINILLDVIFNKEVGSNSALYFEKKTGSLSSLIDKLESNYLEIEKSLEGKALKEIEDRYTWDSIAEKYEKLFYVSVYQNEKEMC